MFWNKNKNETVITTRVTKTSSQSYYEKEIINKAENQARLCPECGHMHKSKEFMGFPLRIEGTNIHLDHSKCEKCGAEWETQYRL